jgi:hypothetical protein
MILTKLLSTQVGFFEYINLEHIEIVEVYDMHYCLCLDSNRMLHIAKNDPTITALVAAA